MRLSFISNQMAKLLYSLGIRCYVLIIHLAAIFNPKARLWIQGRKNWQATLRDKLANVGRSDAPLIWIHCASLGEFEQGRPLLEALRAEQPEARIVLSFFSPSGYEQRKNYPLADIVCYLPADTPNNAKHWLQTLQPNQVFFIKYEFWYHYLALMKQQKIPLYLVAAVFRPNQVFFKPWGAFFRKMLSCFSTIFVQDESSKTQLKDIGIEALVSGDTRIDRVLTIKSAAKDYPLISAFVEDRPCLVCGSSWSADERALAPAIQTLIIKGWRIIIAPHEVHAAHVDGIGKRLNLLASSIVKYSELENLSTVDKQVLIIDNIGMLSSLYCYAKLAYIGGGFGKGIHNTLEAVVYQIPVFFGPNHKKFVEAQDLLKLGVAFELSNPNDFIKALNEVDFEIVQQKIQLYLSQQQGATRRIIEKIQ
jgi:3-deoxy-D-manno-octulosonic-acid transferase